VERPRQELKGFQRVHLDPGQTRTVDLTLKADSLAYWDEKTSAFKVESEPIRLMIGSASNDIKLSKNIQVQ
jgi:beta-glucosidase